MRFFRKHVTPTPGVTAHKPLAKKEGAIADLVYCMTTGLYVPDETKEILNNMPTVLLPEPYREIVEFYQKNPDALDEIEVLYSILLERKIKQRRMRNKDFKPKVEVDIYDKAKV
jgi:hypothetical protein